MSRSAASIVATIAFAATATIAIGASSPIGLWVVAVLGGAVLGGVGMLLAVGFRGAKARDPHLDARDTAAPRLADQRPQTARRAA